MLKKTISLLTLSLLTLILIIISLTGCTPNIEGKYSNSDNNYIKITEDKFTSVSSSDYGNFKCSYKFKDNKIILNTSKLNEDTIKYYGSDYIYYNDEKDIEFIYKDECVLDGLIPDKDYFDATLTEEGAGNGILTFEHIFTESGVYSQNMIMGTRTKEMIKGTYKRQGNLLFIRYESDYFKNEEQYYYIKDGKLYTDVYVRN